MKINMNEQPWQIKRKNKTSGKSRPAIIARGMTSYNAKTLVIHANKAGQAYVYTAEPETVSRIGKLTTGEA